MDSDQSLPTSARQFLIEALGNHRDRKRNFAILHAVTATELVLKERLARIHPTLIYKNIDAPNFQGVQTISLTNLPQRLINLDVSMEPKEAQLISTFAKWRNQIVHHMPVFHEKAADKQLPRLLDFLAVFLRRELNTPLEDFLPKSLYKTASTLLREWNRVVQEAKVKAQAEGTGLGLYVSKMIVESSGGKIWFESKEGIGTAFYVLLPAKGMKAIEGERGLIIS